MTTKVKPQMNDQSVVVEKKKSKNNNKNKIADVGTTMETNVQVNTRAD